MNREYNSSVSSKNSERLLKNLKNTTGDYFFAAPCICNKYLLNAMYATKIALQHAVQNSLWVDSFQQPPNGHTHVRRPIQSKALSTLSQKCETVSQKWDCLKKVTRSQKSVTVAELLFCDSLTFVRQCGQGLMLNSKSDNRLIVNNQIR